MEIWRISDGRAGHDRQVQALLDALSSEMAVSVSTQAPLSIPSALGAMARGLPGRRGTRADLAIGAGHSTHVTLLAARRAHGAKAVVLMRPSLPLAWFDLCVIPRHDRPPRRANMIETLGPLSPVKPADRRGEEGLILLGGPSRHFPWSIDDLREQVWRLAEAEPGRRWQLSPSRRTPPALTEGLVRERPGNVTLVSLADQPAGWLDATLPRAGRCWVTPDSLSMIFDALTAGVPCGVFDLPGAAGSRVAGAVERLVEEGRVLRFERRNPDASPPAVAPLREAERVARELIERLGS